MMDSFTLVTFSLVRFVNSFALGTVRAAQTASYYNSDRDPRSQPDCHVSGEDTGSGADARAHCYAETDLRRGSVHARSPLTTDSSRT
jgi:hypothetical protein